MNPKRLIIDFFTKGHQRSIAAKKNIAASFLIRGANILVGLAIVPITIDYVDPTRYGIWMTLSSLVAWFGFFDIGLGHGLRNRFAEAIAKGEHHLAKVYVSTTYAILTIITLVMIFLFILINQFLDWNQILNASKEIVSGEELSLLALIVFSFFCISFVLKLITTILTADQKPALAAFFDLLGRILALLIIFILTKTTNGSLLYMGFVYSAMPVIVLIGSSFWFYYGRYKLYKPSFKYIDFKQSPHLMNLGVKFFIIHISGVIIIQTNAVIIAQMFNPQEVTVYSVTNQYIAAFASIFSIILTPYWSAFTEAYIKKDIDWIKQQIKRLKNISYMMIFAILLAFAFTDFVFEIWLGNKVKVNYGLSLSITIYTIVVTLSSVTNHFLNGISKIKIQLIIVVIYSFVHIPFTISFCKKFGVEGIMISATLMRLISYILYEIQFNKIINNKAKGIWLA